MPKRKRINVFVLMGGPSAEHEVSLNTGKMVMKNLDQRKFDVEPVLITRTGQWLTGGRVAGSHIASRSTSSFRSGLAHRFTAKGGETALALGAAARLRRNQTYGVSESILKAIRDPARTCVAFIAMHGTYGEDGTIQGLLELAGIPYTGSGVLASALAMDKPLSAEIFRANGIHVPEFIVFSEHEWRKNRATLTRNIAKLHYPLVIKPSNLGSSVGITIVNSPVKLAHAVRNALAYAPIVMAQKYMRGRELTCGVIDNGIPGTAMALQPTEIIPHSGTFFDYRAKYTPGASEEITPPKLPKAMIAKIRQTALTCHKALGCSGMSRTDMILAGDKLYVLEINTIPGLTQTSLLPQAAKACGISFPQLIERIIVAAINRMRYNRS